MVIRDLTTTHSHLIPYFFPESRDIKTTASLFGVIEGAADLKGLAILAPPAAGADPHFSCDIHVFDPWRHQGYEGALYDYVIDLSKQLFAPGVKMLRAVSDGAEKVLLESKGFEVIRVTNNFSFSIAKAHNIFNLTLSRLEGAGRIPDNYRICPYSQGGEAISELCFQEFGLLTHGHLKAVGQYSSGEEDMDYALCIFYRDELVGGLGVSVLGGVATFDPLLVSPSYRDSWAFTVIAHKALKKLLADGVSLGFVQVHQDNRKIMALMARLEANKVGEQALYSINWCAEGVA